MTDQEKKWDGKGHSPMFATPDDVDDQDPSAAVLCRNNEKFQLLADIAGLLLYNEKPSEIIRTIAAKVMDYLNFDVLFNYIIDEIMGRLKLNAYAGVPSEVARDFEWLEFGAAVCGMVARDGVRIIAENIPENTDERLNLFRSLGIKAYACHPLRWGERIIGTMGFGTRLRKSFSPDELALMEIIADQVSVALYRQRNEEELRMKHREFCLDNEKLKKQSEKMMQRLVAIVENSDDAIISMNPQGIISSWNQGAAKLYGYNASEMVGESVLKIVPPEMHDRMNKELVMIIEGQPFEDNNPVRVCKDGTLLNVSIRSSAIRDFRGNVIEVSSIHRNVSERVKFIDGLTKERELLMITLNSLDEAVIATDRDERIFLINETALNLTGYSRFEATDELLGKILYVLDDKTSEPIHDFSSINASALPVLVTRSLAEIPISIHRSPIKNSDGQIIGAVTVFQDISEKQKVVQKLMEQDKLESLGILAGGIAHDFNNVLAAILSNIQLTMLKLKKNEDIKPYLLKTIETTHKASDLTKQLLTFSKGGAPVKKDASLIDLIQDTAEFVLRGSKIKAEFGIPENLWPANVDTGQISQVIQNLVINAKQAMPKGGVLKIFAENLYFDERSFYKPGNYIRISVQDQGVGIPKEILPKIFDPYFTTKKEGNGLGLATSYSIITQHDGYLEVESAEGTGSIFHIYLPASNGAVSLRESRKEAASTADSGYKILLMDDEEIILNAIGEILECYGHQVVPVKDGALAVEEYKRAQSLGDPFDVVIMDLTIPGGMGGQEAVAHLRDLDPKVKAIVSSGYANDPIMSDFERYGFVGVVNKPYKINELNQVLHKVLNSEQLTLMLMY